MDWIYLDNNATTRPAEQVLQIMLPLLAERYANPSSVHHFGGQVRNEIESARAELARLLGCAGEAAGQIVFTSGGTESDQLAVRGVLALAGRQGRNHLVISAVEHSAIYELATRLEQEGCPVTRVGVDRAGRLDLDQLAEAVHPDRTALACVMHANNETGVIFPVGKVAAICRRAGVLLLCDAVQSLGKIPVNVNELGADFLSLSAHKLHGPKGAGALYIRRGVAVAPLLVGHQEQGRRGGTENVPGIIGLVEAARLACDNLVEEQAGVARLRDRLERGLLAAVPDAVINGQEPRLGNTTNISFPGCSSEALLVALSEHQIAASAGAACASGSAEPSHVLRAMGLPPILARGAVRFSLSRYTRPEQIDRVVEILPMLVARLRSLNV